MEEERREALRENIAANRQKKAETIDLVAFAEKHQAPELLDYEPVHKWESQKPTGKQLALLERNGIDTDGMTKGLASRCISILLAPSENS